MQTNEPFNQRLDVDHVSLVSRYTYLNIEMDVGCFFFSSFPAIINFL